jgi:hypothetical protein
MTSPLDDGNEPLLPRDIPLVNVTTVIGTHAGPHAWLRRGEGLKASQTSESNFSPCYNNLHAVFT